MLKRLEKEILFKVIAIVLHLGWEIEVLIFELF